MIEQVQEFFPNGWVTYASGGALVGLGVAMIFAVTGVRAGASGVLTAALGYVSQSRTIQALRSERSWRIAFTLGLLGGGALVALTLPGFEPTEVAAWRLAIGGFLVGIGTRFARGCTSGHGICGLSSLEPRSLLHVGVFMSVAIVVAQSMRGLL